jgi:hypothetical protein
MKQSDELRDLVLQWYEGISSGDIVSTTENMFSRQDGVLSIGTDPNEWWEGYGDIIESRKQSVFQVEAGDPKAYCEGTVGWIADRITFKGSDGTKVPFRLTAVFHKENGEWKIVQQHVSIGVPNEELQRYAV